MLTDELIRGQAQHLIGALLAHNFVPKTLPEELYVKLWDVVMAQLKCVNHEGARAIESAATAPLLARIAELTRELEEARKDAEELKFLNGDLLYWVDRAVSKGNANSDTEDAYERYEKWLLARHNAAIKEQT